MILLTLYLIFKYSGYCKPKRRNRKAQIQLARMPTVTAAPAKTEKQRQQESKKQARIAQAELDIGHYSERLETFTIMHRDATQILQAAQEQVNRDKELSRYGAQSRKIVASHIRDRDRAQKTVLSYAAQIHAAQIKVAQAESILNQTE